MIRQLRQANRRLEDELAQARQRERQRLAATLHDEIGGDLTAAIIRLQRIVVREDCPSPTAVESAIRALSSAIQHTRALTSDLFPLGSNAPTLRRTLASLVDQARDRFELDVTLRVEGEMPLVPPAVCDAVVAIVRELLLNVAKHAGARTCQVAVRCDDATLRIEVADDGVGLGRSSSGSGVGLILARQRIGEAGGRIEVVSQPGCGTRIEIAVPLDYSREVTHGPVHSAG